MRAWNLSIILVWMGLQLLSHVFGAGAHADDVRPALSLQGTWMVEIASSDPVAGVVWHAESSGPIQGGAFVQTRAYPVDQVKNCVANRVTTGVCKRLRIRADKPSDKVAALAVQFPGRTFRVSAAAGQAYAELILNELSLDDYGEMALQLVVEGGSTQKFGGLVLRTHGQDLVPAAVAALTHDGQMIRDGDHLESGWWFLFFGSAPGVDVVEDGTDLLSLCGFYPDGSVECADGGNTLQVRVRRNGDYLFVAWNKDLQSSEIRFKGV